MFALLLVKINSYLIGSYLVCGRIINMMIVAAKLTIMSNGRCDVTYV